MNKVYFLDIAEQDGLYVFNRNQVLINGFAKSYQVAVPSSDNISTLNDLIISIEDEEADIVLIALNKNCSQLIISIVKTLASEADCRVVLLSSNLERAGRVNLDGVVCDVICTIDDLKPDGLERNLFQPETVFDMETVYSGGYLYTMRNGVNALYSGAYPAANFLSNLKHLVIKDDSHTPDLSKITDLLDINSAIIFPKYDPKRFEQLKGFEKPVYSHIHQIDGNVMHLDNSGNEVVIDVENYSKCDDNKSAFVRITSRDDIKSLKHDVDLFKRTGKIAKLGNRFINECALGISPCVLSKVFRGTVDAEGVLYPCPECANSIGSVYDDCFDLVKSATQISRKSQIRRHCENCSASQTCSKCAMLPEGITEEDYCELVRYEGTVDYCKKLTLLGMVLENGRVVLSKNEYSMVEVSSYYRPLIANRNEYNTVSTSTQRHIVLLCFRYKGSYYVFAYKSSKLYKTDERFVYIAELYAYGISDHTLIEKYSGKFGIELKAATDHVTEAIQTITNEVIA